MKIFIIQAYGLPLVTAVQETFDEDSGISFPRKNNKVQCSVQVQNLGTSIQCPHMSKQ